MIKTPSTFINFTFSANHCDQITPTIVPHLDFSAPTSHIPTAYTILITHPLFATALLQFQPASASRPRNSICSRIITRSRRRAARAAAGSASGCAACAGESSSTSGYRYSSGCPSTARNTLSATWWLDSPSASPSYRRRSPTRT